MTHEELILKIEMLLMLLEGKECLSNEQIDDLLANKREIADALYELWRAFPRSVETLQRCRKKKQEFMSLPVEKLVEMRNSERAHRVAVRIADVNDELDDSYYESPSADSDEVIITEILKEMGKEK